MASCVTFEYIRKNPDIRTYIQRADDALKAIGYTEHAFAHVEKTAHIAAKILTTLGYSEREVELARIAGFLHDIGNVINRADHAQSGAVMAFRLLDRLEMPVEEICSVISAIGNHDEATAQPIDAISAALILADKTDVRRSRVRNTDFLTFDIHDRVNYAVETAELLINKEQQEFVLSMTIDTQISSVLEYFEIFMERMLLCRRAAQFFHMQFKIYINHSLML
ncbi:MAG: HD domain-containing protein [Oscillospiraceae bacterium]|nr:HD domain-containing protein [Oscillospiraceae bacterium]MDD7295113.1 HD domain-containing protein [Oscillospiraceae bacterium]MDY2510860.1 HD domain-containing protein [Ruminococcus callidus]